MTAADVERLAAGVALVLVLLCTIAIGQCEAWRADQPALAGALR